MAWPTDDLTTDHLDAGADSPADARPMLKKALDYLKDIIVALGVAGGICELDANAKVPAARIGRGAADGVAPLDAAARLPATHLPDATADAAGAVRLATDAEAENASGTGALQARQLALRTATTGRAGPVELATNAEGIAGRDRTRAMTPAVNKAVLDLALAGVTGGLSSDQVQIDNRQGPNQGHGSILARISSALERSVSNSGTVTITLVETRHYEEDESEEN